MGNCITKNNSRPSCGETVHQHQQQHSLVDAIAAVDDSPTTPSLVAAAVAGSSTPTNAGATEGEPQQQQQRGDQHDAEAEATAATAADHDPDDQWWSVLRRSGSSSSFGAVCGGDSDKAALTGTDDTSVASSVSSRSSSVSSRNSWSDLSSLSRSTSFSDMATAVAASAERRLTTKFSLTSDPSKKKRKNKNKNINSNSSNLADAGMSECSPQTPPRFRRATSSYDPLKEDIALSNLQHPGSSFSSSSSSAAESHISNRYNSVHEAAPARQQRTAPLLAPRNMMGGSDDINNVDAIHFIGDNQDDDDEEQYADLDSEGRRLEPVVVATAPPPRVSKNKKSSSNSNNTTNEPLWTPAVMLDSSSATMMEVVHEEESDDDDHNNEKSTASSLSLPRVHAVFPSDGLPCSCDDSMEAACAFTPPELALGEDDSLNKSSMSNLQQHRQAPYQGARRQHRMARLGVQLQRGGSGAQRRANSFSSSSSSAGRRHVAAEQSRSSFPSYESVMSEQQSNTKSSSNSSNNLGTASFDSIPLVSSNGSSNSNNSLGGSVDHVPPRWRWGAPPPFSAAAKF